MAVQSPVASRAPFPKPPRWAVVLLVVLAVGGAGHFFVAVAQITTADVEAQFLDCMREPTNPNSITSMRDATDDDSEMAGAIPTRGPFETVTIDELVNEVFMCSLQFGSTVIGPIGLQILFPLALIMTVWFGVTVMFGGGGPSEVLGFLMRMGLVAMLMQNYFFATPQSTPFGDSQGVVWTVAQQGIILGRTLVEDARDFVDTAYNNAREAAMRREIARIVSNIMDPDTEYTAEEVSEFEAAARRGVEMRAEEQVENWLLGIFERSWRTFLWIIKWIVYAQYLWGFVGLSVIGILGPLFIPWMIVPQLDWLFWSWFRALIQVTIQMMTSAVMYVVASMILTVPLAQIAGFRYNPDPESAGDMAVFLLSLIIPYTPIILIVAAAALKAGAFASGLMSGSGMTGGGLVGGSGLGGGVFQAATLATNPQARQAAMRAARQNLGAAGHVLSQGYQAGRAGKFFAILPLSRATAGWHDAQDVYRDYAYRRDRLDRLRGDRADRARSRSSGGDVPPGREGSSSNPHGSGGGSGGGGGARPIGGYDAEWRERGYEPPRFIGAHAIDFDRLDDVLSKRDVYSDEDWRVLGHEPPRKIDPLSESSDADLSAEMQKTLDDLKESLEADRQMVQDRWQAANERRTQAGLDPLEPIDWNAEFERMNRRREGGA